MNSCNFIGNLGSDPQLRKTASGTSVLNFSIAVDRLTSVETQEGVIYQKTADWIPVVVFGDEADHQHKHLQKGSKIAIVNGEVRPRTYTDRQNVTHHSFEVLAKKIEWLDNIRSAESTATV